MLELMSIRKIRLVVDFTLCALLSSPFSFLSAGSQFFTSLLVRIRGEILVLLALSFFLEFFL